MFPVQVIDSIFTNDPGNAIHNIGTIYLFFKSTGIIFYRNIKEPLINYVMSLAHRLICNQGATLTGFCSCKTCISTILAVKACVGLVKSCNVECGSACEPHRAGSETHIYGVALLTNDLGHLPRSASCSCTLQNPQRYDIIDQRFLKQYELFRVDYNLLP